MLIWNMVDQQWEEFLPWMRYCPDYFIRTAQWATIFAAESNRDRQSIPTPA